MKYLFLLIVLILSVSSGAMAQTASCSKVYAKSTYWKLKGMPISDKTMHCALSCDLTRLCGSTLTVGLGIAKEIYDIFGDGNAEWEDLRADIQGVRFARRGARSFGQCLRVCSKLYEPQ